MSDGKASNDSGRQKSTRFAALSAPSEEMSKHTRGSLIVADRDYVNFHAVTLHDELANVVVRRATDFMTGSQNIHYKISSQQKLQTYDEYVPKSANIKLELAIEKGTKEGKALQSLTEKYSQVIDVELLSLPQASARKIINSKPKVVQVSSQRTHSACLARAGTHQPVLVRAGTRHAC